ncbi:MULTISPECIES: hypothetical protein [Thermomonospora]|uniref:hypothetical protein n=1 Tax=Thermomonospora TaxID=2019 RepID=UPI00019ED5B4|nr:MULTISPECIES: hypothetical protein [Thermomonospora]PKK13785.1 MAG: hypothetical protein BUE48_015195 [Thermomonospora sp. CIF 1]
MEISDDAWWYCLRHMRVEHGPGCANKDRMGPYRTEAEAAGALELARRRNEAWDEQDDEGDD